MNKPTRDQELLNVAVWGLGAHAIRTVLPAIANSPRVRLVGVHSRNMQVAREQAAIYACEIWSDKQSMLESPAVDVVFLATPTALHFEQSYQILDHAKHLWCEKPLATNLGDAEELIHLANSKKRSLAVVCAPLYHPMFETICAQLEQGHLGKIESIAAAFRFPHIEPENFRYKPELGGGALLDLGFYLFTVVDAIMPGAPVNLECQIETEKGYHVDTGGQAKVTYGNGVTVDLSWGFGFDYENRLMVEGAAGVLSAQPFFSKPSNISPFLEIKDHTGLITNIPFAHKNQFEEMIAIFSRAAHDSDIKAQLIDVAHRSQSLLARASASAQKIIPS